MAKTGLWLRGAKGKIAGAVAYKAENSTVLREHVIPKNPRTTAQMLQRVAFGTAATAAKLLLPIIGQTFQGMASEKLNRRAFMKANITALRAAGVAQVGALQNEKFSYAFNPKNGGIAVVPNPWIISNGTLARPNVNFTFGEDANHCTVLNNVEFGRFTFATGDVVTAEEIIEAIFGDINGGQLTFVGIMSKNGAPILVGDFSDYTGNTYPSLDYELLRETLLAARRLVTKDSGGATLTIAQDTDENALIDFMLNGIDQEKTSADILNLIQGMTVVSGTEGTNPSFGFEATKVWKLFGLSSDNDYIVASVGAFVSRYENSLWKYSTCVMTNIPSDGDANVESPDNTRYGFDVNAAILSYIGYGSVSSTLYTREGTEVGNSIGSF